MSATMNWASSGLATKTNTTNAALLDDLDTLITSKSGDATFKWEKAGKSNAGTPRYLLLRRKDASAGRLAIIIWDSAPANNNVAILDGNPLANGVQIAFFPAGTGTTLSNLTAASGTICGDDTNAVKCMTCGTVANVYAASVQVFYFDDAEAMVFVFQNPATTTVGMLGAGALVIDGSDLVYDCTMANNATNRWDNMGSGAFMPWTAGALAAGATGSGVRTNYGSSNRTYYSAFQTTGNWAASAVSATDIMSDSGLNKNWYMALQLMSSTVKGEGPVLKFRQIGIGSGTVGPLQPYNTTGPVVQARQANASTTGANGSPWMLNFKL